VLKAAFFFSPLSLFPYRTAADHRRGVAVNRSSCRWPWDTFFPFSPFFFPLLFRQGPEISTPANVGKPVHQPPFFFFRFFNHMLVPKFGGGFFFSSFLFFSQICVPTLLENCGIFLVDDWKTPWRRSYSFFSFPPFPFPFTAIHSNCLRLIQLRNSFLFLFFFFFLLADSFQRSPFSERGFT